MEQVLVETPYNLFKPTAYPHYNYTQHQKSNIICCNCGGIGHVYARCNHPITSYGIICYRLAYDSKMNSIYPEYLMVQRKDSLSYVEFMRGKYDLQNISYVIKLFSNMIEDERVGIMNSDFETLWTSLWSTTNGKNFMKEYMNSKDKFDKLKNGYLIRSIESDNPNEVLLVNLDYIIANTHPNLEETEWGFPKGRRSFSDEDDRRCAMREFREETAINLKNIKLVRDLKPFEEVFSGTNKIRYKHVYYIAKYSQLPCTINQELFDPNNKHQAREIKDVRWFTYNDAQEKIKNINVERKELLKRVNNMILRSIHM
jgi:8-oxo-dGTP pyrophosphatase MutT (NUDIX family)